jgi:hypothetical protein
LREIRDWGRSNFNVAEGNAQLRKTERVVVPGKPGNAGGGKDPHFKRALEAAKDG